MRYLLFLLALPAWAQFGAASSVVSGNGAPVSAQCVNANNVGRVWARKDGGAADTTFYVCSNTGVGTYAWSLFGASPSGGAIGGASAVAATQVLYGVSAGVAGSSSVFLADPATGQFTIGNTGFAGYSRWRNSAATAVGFSGVAAQFMSTGTSTDFGFRSTGSILFATNGDNERARFAATTGNLLLKTTTDDGVNALQVAGNVAGTVTAALSLQDGATSLRLASTLSTSSTAGNSGAGITFAQRYINSDANPIRVGAINGWKTAVNGSYGGGVQLYHQTTAGVDMTPTLSTFHTGNVAISTTTDGNFKLDIASSGSSGTLRAYDQTATTGVTQFIVRAGAGQSSTNLQTWQNNAGSTLAAIGSNGSGYLVNYYDAGGTIFNVNTVGFDVRSAYLHRWSSTTLENGTKDLSLSRASANTLQVGDGGSNSLGSLVTANGTFNTQLVLGGVVAPIKFWGGASLDLDLRRNAAGVLAISNTGTTGGGLLIEALKSTTGTRYVCVDTTGRFTSSASACSGT